MSWKKIERVQPVSALLCQGLDISPILKRLQSGPKAYQDIELAQGEGWQIVFGNRLNAEDYILPHITGAAPLFKAFSDIWMSVGTAFDLPKQAQEDYIEKIRADHELFGQDIVIAPRFTRAAGKTNAADIFIIEQRLAISELSLESVA